MVRYRSKFIQSLDSRKYWSATKKACDLHLVRLLEISNESKACIEILNQLSKIMYESEADVNRIQKERIRLGEISDSGQSSVSVAGNNFQALFAYCLELNRLIGNIPKDLQIILKPKNHRIIKEYAIIKVSDEKQKPDVDVLVYQEKESPIVVYSCKTSLRERAGQTYRWKLLMDLALCKCDHDPNCPLNDYELQYSSSRKIMMGLVTGDFYDEREHDQQKGMFKFFDYVYVSKQITEFANVKRLGEIIADLNFVFK